MSNCKVVGFIQLKAEKVLPDLQTAQSSRAKVVGFSENVYRSSIRAARKERKEKKRRRGNTNLKELLLLRSSGGHLMQSPFQAILGM